MKPRMTIEIFEKHYFATEMDALKAFQDHANVFAERGTIIVMDSLLTMQRWQSDDPWSIKVVYHYWS